MMSNVRLSSPERIELSIEGSTCPICLDLWEKSGQHRLSALRCGHLFGESCIRRWDMRSCALDRALFIVCTSLYCTADGSPAWRRTNAAVRRVRPRAGWATFGSFTPGTSRPWTRVNCSGCSGGLTMKSGKCLCWTRRWHSCVRSWTVCETMRTNWTRSNCAVGVHVFIKLQQQNYIQSYIVQKMCFLCFF